MKMLPSVWRGRCGWASAAGTRAARMIGLTISDSPWRESTPPASGNEPTPRASPGRLSRAREDQLLAGELCRAGPPQASRLSAKSLGNGSSRTGEPLPKHAQPGKQAVCPPQA